MSPITRHHALHNALAQEITISDRQLLSYLPSQVQKDISAFWENEVLDLDAFNGLSAEAQSYLKKDSSLSLETKADLLKLLKKMRGLIVQYVEFPNLLDEEHKDENPLLRHPVDRQQALAIARKLVGMLAKHPPDETQKKRISYFLASAENIKFSNLILDLLTQSHLIETSMRQSRLSFPEDPLLQLLARQQRKRGLWTVFKTSRLARLLVLGSTLVIVFFVAQFSFNPLFSCELKSLFSGDHFNTRFMLDKSASISERTLSHLKAALTQRLKVFMYQGDRVAVWDFGGHCRQVTSVIPTKNVPTNPTDFTEQIERPLNAVKRVTGRDTRTPLNLAIQEALKENFRGKVMILSDMVDDQEDCPEKVNFPRDDLIKFGQSGGELLLLTLPSEFSQGSESLLYDSYIKIQNDFINQVWLLKKSGRLKVTVIRVSEEEAKDEAQILRHLETLTPAGVVGRANQRINSLITALFGSRG
ncbi:MAG: VWA domain-containing protein [Deltaproteobacteria bacterium]|nr:VWA domain-containing protein [Deltaproteobacteria bacterium]